MAQFNFSRDDPKAAKQAMQHMRDMMGPSAIDHLIRQAIQHCWMMMDPKQKTSAALVAEIRRIVDRALRDFQDDARAFGLGDGSERQKRKRK